MLALTLANLKMMSRNWHSTFWALALPLLLVLVFGLFDVDNTGSAKIAVIDNANNPQSRLLQRKLAEIEFLKLEQLRTDIVKARKMLLDRDLDYVLVIPMGFGTTAAQGEVTVPTPIAFVYNTSNVKRNQLVEGVLRNRVSELSSSQNPGATAIPVISDLIEVTEASYLDLVLMGLVSLAIMNHSIIAIAVKISTYRNQSIFKRMLATPLSIWKYFASEVAAHLVLALLQAAIIMAVGVFLLGAKIHGNIIWIFAIVALGNLVFLNMGFILSAWANTPAAASAMGNVIALPMVFLAGTFFSTSTLPGFLQYVSEVLPLTPMLSGLRQVAIDSAPIWDAWPQVAALAAWIVATGAVAVKVFRFS